MRRFWPQFGHHSERHLGNRLLAVPSSFIGTLLCLQVNIGSYNAVCVQTSPLEILHFKPEFQLNYTKDLLMDCMCKVDDDFIFNV